MDKRNKKIGIITIHFPYNYGAMLQAYATQTFLKESGYNAEIIDFRPYEIDKNYHIRKQMLKDNPKLYVNMCIGKIIGKRKKYRSFEKFIKNNLVLSNKNYKQNINLDKKDYDVVVAGSDQIWNPDIMSNRYEYLLDFKTNAQRISYASSFGQSTIDSKELNEMKEHFEKFSSLAVREDEGIKILNKININNVSRVCDPVFLLSTKEWEELELKVDNLPNKYLLLYSLQNNEQLNNAIIEMSQKTGIKIISIHPTGMKQDFANFNINNIGPKEFLYLINHAEYVFSNSFHAVAFSIIFEKKIFAYLHTSTGARVENILKKFEMIKDNDLGNQLTYYCKSEKTKSAKKEFINYSKKHFVEMIEKGE